MFKSSQEINGHPVFLDFISSAFGAHDYKVVSRALDHPTRARFGGDGKIIRAYDGVPEATAQAAYDEFKEHDAVKFAEWLSKRSA